MQFSSVGSYHRGVFIEPKLTHSFWAHHISVSEITSNHLQQALIDLQLISIILCSVSLQRVHRVLLLSYNEIACQAEGVHSFLAITLE